MELRRQYELSLTDEEKCNRGTAYALAVDESVIAQNETAAAAYEQFLTYGF